MSRMKKSALAVSTLAMFAASAAYADVAFNAGVVSDYRFRGVSQSASDPALQGGIDFTDKSGLYLGAWGSTIDFGLVDADIEIDLYGGYKWKAANIDWDLGLIHYAYPSSDSAADLPFTELYIGGTKGPVTIKYAYSPDFTGTNDEPASYLSIAGNIDLGSGYTLGLSAGLSKGDGLIGAGLSDDSYTDYKIGVSKDFAGVTFNLSYIDTSGLVEITTDEFNTEGTVVLTVSKTF